MSAYALGVEENRSASRVRVPGWANIGYSDAVVKSDRLYDISQTGISLFLDIQLPLRQDYQLQLTVYRQGKVKHLEARARCVHSTLVRISGFRHGFHFSPMEEQDQDALMHMLE